MKIRRISAAVALVATGALVLAACSNAPQDEPSSPATSAGGDSGSGGTLTVAETNQFYTFNPNTSNGNNDINSKIVVYPTWSWFNYVDGTSFAAGDPQLIKDESFGTYEIVSEDPFVTKWTVNEGVQWSDGNPVDAGDLLLAWAVASGHYDSEAVSYFDYAGDTGTLSLVDFPEIGDDGRSITFTYSEPAADWEVAYIAQVPAHVLATHAGLADEQALVDLFTELKDTAPTATEADPRLQAVADFFNTGFDTTVLPSDPELYLSSGPYIVSDIVENQSVTLVPNENYVGANTAKLDQIVMRTIPDATAAVQALQNGDVDVISPQSSADTLAALAAIDGIQVHQGDQLSYDHLDLTFNNGGPFDAAAYGGDADKALKVRQAFLKTVPRQAILDAIIIPQKADAQILNSQIYLSTDAGYDNSVSTNGSDAYPGEPDIEGAKALLAEAGVTSPTVRILYNINNPNRVNAYTLIAASATEAGFVIVDEGDAAWGSRLADGSYDASIFGWISSGFGVSNVPQVFRSTGGGNYNGYSNAEVDTRADELVVTLDTERQEEIKTEMDPFMFADAYGLPLFQSVGVDAVSDQVSGITEYNPNQAGVWWNVWEWSIS